MNVMTIPNDYHNTQFYTTGQDYSYYNAENAIYYLLNLQKYRIIQLTNFNDIPK